jgi:monoamine oxidase
LDCIIIGAGLAGLSSALTLQRAGKRVCILEGRSRVGGRVFTHPAGIDLGASWLSGDVNSSVYDVAKAHNLALLPSNTCSPTLYEAGGALEGATASSVASTFEALEGRVAELSAGLREAGRSAPYAELWASAIAGAQVSGDMDAYMHRMSAAHQETLYAAPLASLSGAWYHEPPNQGQEYVFTRGFSEVPRALAGALEPGTLFLNTRVTEIHWSEEAGGGVRVVCGQRVFLGKAAICTLPLGVLKAACLGANGAPVFRPPLPEAHARAIHNLGFGTLNKAWAVLERDPEPSNPAVNCLVYLGGVGCGGSGGGSSPGDPFPFPYLLKVRREDGTCAITGLCVGSGEATVGTMTSTLIKQLSLMFGEGLPPIRSVGAVQWDKDELALGSYSYQSLESTPADRVALRAPLGALCFAGEHCETVGCGYTHGALQSGTRAAELVAESLALQLQVEVK